MTDILDLPGWTVLSKSQSGGEYLIEAEYTVQPTACPKCGVIDTPYKHGVKPIKYRDSPIRGDSVNILAQVQRYRCQSCLGVYEPSELYVTRMGVVLEDEPMTNRTLMCAHCKERFHTEGVKHGHSPSTP